MSNIQSLRKKLKGIRTTQKISKAMKTSSTIKFSRLHSAFVSYSEYCDQYRQLYKRHRKLYNACFFNKSTDAPTAIVVLSSNKGMCGGFNSETFYFAKKRIEELETPPTVFLCGKKATEFFTAKDLPFERSFEFKDIPTYEDAADMFNTLTEYLSEGKVSSIRFIYPKYINMMYQFVDECELFDSSDTDDELENSLAFPDEVSFIESTAKKIAHAFIFEKILECALGAQAATLVTMRSAYDNATEYSLLLEGEINRKRQSRVTSDVIETASGRSQKEM